MSEKNDISINPIRSGVRFRLWLALFLVLAAAVSVMVATQHAALAAASCSPTQPKGSDEWDIPLGCASQQVKAAHTCLVVGKSNDGKTEGIECADIYVTNTEDTQEMWGEGEFYCAGVHTKCLGMNVEIWTSAKAQQTGVIPPRATTTHGSHACNTKPACPSGSKLGVSTAHIGLGAGCTFMHSFELPDGASFEGNTNHDVISINGASTASHAKGENLSHNVLVCLKGGPPIIPPN